ncbi:sodium/glutamate symporter [Silvimonas iriomotensis]|uniref:Sodium/glutamate symporter n=1 Tax=Silvimonas iriomotensis TaxID=449662 RepID=A0ABQ2P4Z0_9NEIS|nr:sodium/glutamate symporter [Silvimonas iriomotensis]GGP18475.1 sodium/glutamate symporter [Silvimonas iriomotensis]
MQLDVYGTLVAASLVLLVGRLLISRLAFLRNYSIPEPVAGGLIVALVLALAHSALQVDVNFDKSLQTPLMLAFFASIGLNADLASLRRGKVLTVFLLVVTGLLITQNLVGAGLSLALGINPQFGLLAGSITLSGGHGTGAAWAKVFTEKYGLASATEIAIACATFGLVCGGLLGGPVARFLVRRVKLPDEKHSSTAGAHTFEQPHAMRLITVQSFIETLALIAVSLLGGQYIAGLLGGTAAELPVFVCVLFVGVVLRNVLGLTGWYRVFDRAVSVLGNVSLSLFLAMALMSLRLWELGGLALPVFIILAVQTLVMAAYAIFVTFRVMGANYDAAVLAAGHCGFGLGATPTAIANMQAVTDRFGPSHISFLVVPMVGAFFIDIINAIAIKLFLALPFYG